MAGSGPLPGSDAEIGVGAETEPYKLAEPGIEYRSQVFEARRGSVALKAVIVLTRGTIRPGLFLMNASRFQQAVRPTHAANFERRKRITEAAGPEPHGSDVCCSSTPDDRIELYNVTVRIPGSNPTLAPLVSHGAPRSGWWQCASEQGSRLACWLEAIRVVAGGNPARDCFFVALSGHELDLWEWLRGISKVVRT